MDEKVLKLNLYQPFAHYREPKIMQDDYIPTLNIPSPTTIAGMVSYVCDYKFKDEFDIGIYCTYKMKDTQFIRGEYGGLFAKYLRQSNQSKLSYTDFKFNEGNRIMNYEVLQEVELIVFLKFSNIDEFNLVKYSFENPTRYISLGRKEDFAVKQKGKKLVEDISDKITPVNIESKKYALKNQYKTMNTYIPVKLNDNKCDDVLNNGILYSLPKTYKDIKEDKINREFIFQHYVYIDEEGYYPKEGNYNLYEKDEEKYLFKWIVKEGK